MPLTKHGQKLLVLSQFGRAKSFLGAALLLRQRGGDEYVVLHLICQSIEIATKSVLISIDFSKNTSEKLRKKYNHDLAKLVPNAFEEVGLRPLQAPILEELQKLNDLYIKHWLRYPSPYNILVDPKTIPSGLVLFKLAAAIRLAERELTRA